MNALRNVNLAPLQPLRLTSTDDQLDLRRPLKVGCYLFFARGGIARYTHEVMSVLSRNRDLRIELLCNRDYEPPTASSYDLWRGLAALSHRWPTLRRARFIAGQIINPQRLCRRADEKQFDIIHFSDFNHLTYPLWRKQARRGGRKIVVTVHDIHRGVALLNRSFEDAQLRRVYREADALFVHSRAQADELIDWAKVDSHSVYVVPCGPFCYGEPHEDRATLRQRYGLPMHKQVALSFGNLRDDKNLERLIRVLPKQRDQVHLFVAGRAASRGQKSREFYRQLCVDLGVADCVTFLTRYLSDSEVADVFTAADWVALPYSRTFTSQSGVLSVAARYHRPVLACNIATFRETMSGQDIGVCIEPDDDDALHEGIATICDRVRSGHVYRFDDYLRVNSWATNARLTADVYAKLVSND